MKKIGLVGFFGWGNFGDELFVEVHKQMLGEEFELSVVHDLLEAPYFSDEALAKLSTDYDAFLIGGGDLINPRAVSALYWRKEYLEKPVFVYGIGCPVLNIKESPSINYFREFFSHENVKFICLRDIESKKYFDQVIRPSIESVTFPDAVCALDLPARVKDKSSGKTLGLILRSHRSLAGEYAEVRRAVEHAKSLGYQVKIIVGSTGDLGSDDFIVSEKFKVDEEDLFFSQDLYEICKEIGSCDLLLSMKFHGLIVATMYGVPTIQMSSTQKNRNLFRYLQRPDLLGNYQDHDLYLKIPLIPAPIHSILIKKMKRDATLGYNLLIEKLKESI